MHALALARLGKVGAGEAALDRALAAARRANDRRRSNAVLANAPLAALWGPGPVARASGRCLDVVRVLRITQGAPAVEAVALRCQAVLEALRGRAEAARRMIASSRRMVEELGITQGLLETEMFAGLIELIEGDIAAAERSLRAAYDGLRNHGLGIDAARAAGLLGRTLLAQGRAAEAEALSHESEALAGDDLQAAITWRRVRAEALARRGEHAAAVEFARAAVDIAAATDALLHHADARLTLAVALRAAGRGDEAAAEEARAIELWEAKGATVLSERARRGAGRVRQVDRAPDDRAEPVPVRRRVRANAATANTARVDAAVVGRDVDAILAAYADGAEVVHHPTGAVYDRRGSFDTFHSLFTAKDVTLVHDPLATLGDSLALCRQSLSHSGLSFDGLTTGPVEREEIGVIEVDARGQRTRGEFFAADRLGDAVARLYERYADLLPDGPARARAAATARSVAALLGPFDPERYAPAFAPAPEAVDHRTLGTWSARGAEPFLQHLRAMVELADDLAMREDEVLGLQPDALLVRRTHSGTDRAGGGAYERPFIHLVVFGPDGLWTRTEYFESDGDAEALARFDELTAEPAAVPPRAAEKRHRRARANAATAQAARMDAAVAARDADAFPELLADVVEVVHHPTGAVYDRAGSLATWRSLLKVEDVTYWREPLATLGDSLALLRDSLSANAVAGRTFDVGAYEREQLDLTEVDAQGRYRRAEVFATDRLGDAVARMYERHAKLLPDGPERTRAAAMARSIAALLGPPDVDRWATAFAPSIELVDHRIVGIGSLHGVPQFRDALRTLFEAADDMANRVDDVLALRSDAALLRITNFGTEDTGGGTYERPFLMVWIFGADGLVTHLEQFDVGHEAEALARFDDLTTAPAPARSISRRVRANAATANTARHDGAFAGRDTDALATLYADEVEIVEHPTGAVYDREGALRSLRPLLGARDPAYRHEPLATLGDTLALFRLSWSASGFAGGKFDVGAYEVERFNLVEVAAEGRRRRVESFGFDRLADAIARLYERYADLLPDGPARTRAAATARSAAAMLGPFDVERYATALCPAIEIVDHRILGTWSARGAAPFLQHVRAMLEVADDIVMREDEVLSLQSDALLVRRAHCGTDRAGGGAYEWLFISLWVFGYDGLLARIEYFDADRDAEALARFDELVTAAPAVRFENAATRWSDRLENAWEARDWERVAAGFAPGLRVIDRRKLVRIELDRGGHLETLRFVFQMRASRLTARLLATRGDRLALARTRFEASDHDAGPSDVEFLRVSEVDDRGAAVAIVAFDPDDLDAAYAELDDRYLAGEAAPYARTWETWWRQVRATAARDWEQLASGFAPDLVTEDHRPLGVLTLGSCDEYVASVRALLDLRSDARLRVEHVLALDDRRSLTVVRWEGGELEGTFEIPAVVVSENGLDGVRRQQHVHNLDQLDEAWARFAELGSRRNAT